MPLKPQKTLKEYASDAAERLKKSKSGTTPAKAAVKKLPKPPIKGK